MSKNNYFPVKYWAEKDGRNIRAAQRKAKKLDLGCKIWRGRLITAEEWELIKVEERGKYDRSKMRNKPHN